MILRPLLCTPAFGCQLDYTDVREGRLVNVTVRARCERHAALAADALVVDAILEETERERELLRVVHLVAPAFALGASARWIEADGRLRMQIAGLVTPADHAAIRELVARHPLAARFAVL